jgi:hypothetical protein
VNELIRKLAGNPLLGRLNVLANSSVPHDRFFYKQVDIPGEDNWHAPPLPDHPPDLILAYAERPRDLWRRNLSNGDALIGWQELGYPIYIGLERKGVRVPILWLGAFHALTLDEIRMMAPPRQVAWVLEEMFRRPELRSTAEELSAHLFPGGYPQIDMLPTEDSVFAGVGKIQEAVRSATVQIQASAAASKGSGVCTSSNGARYVLTAAHAVDGYAASPQEGEERIRGLRPLVTFAKGGSLPARIVAYDWNAELALLSMGSSAPDSASLQLGGSVSKPMAVIRAGFPKPHGPFRIPSGEVKQRLLQSTKEDASEQVLIWDWTEAGNRRPDPRPYEQLQLRTTQRSGFSGGPLVDTVSGRVVGIFSGGASTFALASRVSASTVERLLARHPVR